MKDIDLSKLQVKQDTAFSFDGKVKHRWKLWHVIVALVVVVLVYLWIFPPAVSVQTSHVVTAYPSDQYVVLNSTGYVVARRKAAVASKATGRLEWLGVSEGSVVKAGTLLARLQSRDVEASLANATANVAVASSALVSASVEFSNAQSTFHRYGALIKDHYISVVMYEDARARYLRAQASVRSASAALDAARANEDFAKDAVDATRITAPFDGVVISRSANVGDIVTPMSSAADSKGAVVVMADMSSLEVDADVSESSLSQIHVGQPCEIQLDAFPGRRFSGEISAVVPTVNRSSATVTTKVRILDPDAHILPDMSARVSFLSRPVNLAAEKPVLAVSVDAIHATESGAVVFALNPQDKIIAVRVAPGLRMGDLQTFTGALQNGQEVVVHPSLRVHDGATYVRAEAH